MTLGELMDYTRQHVLRDNANPKLWPDDLLILYFNEAQDQFARRTHCLSDAESDFTFVETEDGVSTYTMDPRVVFVAEVIHQDTGIPVRDRSRRQVARRFGAGRPVAYTMDAGMQKLRLHPTPDGAYVLDLLVARRPLNKLVNETDVPEIPEQHHMDLCDWVVYRCLRNNDPETSTMTATPEAYRAEWDMKVRDAKREVFRLRADDNPTARGNWTGKLR